MRPHPFLPTIRDLLARRSPHGSSGGDKAGGTRASKPIVLTLANGNGDTPRALSCTRSW